MTANHEHHRKMVVTGLLKLWGEKKKKKKKKRESNNNNNRTALHLITEHFPYKACIPSFEHTEIKYTHVRTERQLQKQEGLRENYPIQSYKSAVLMVDSVLLLSMAVMVMRMTMIIRMTIDAPYPLLRLLVTVSTLHWTILAARNALFQLIVFGI